MMHRRSSALNRMQKVDIAIAALGAVALLATGLGIAFYEEINGLEEYTVNVSEQQTFEDSGDVPAGGLEWTFDAPENTFHAGGELTIAWTATNPALSGDVDVTVTVTGPDGTVDELTETFDFADNEGVVSLDLSAWAEVPETFAGTQDDVEERTINWDDPLTIEISITGPQGPLPIPQDDPTYTADLAGYWHTYTMSREIPDVENI